MVLPLKLRKMLHQRRRSILLLLGIVFVVVTTACDPVYSVQVNNQTTDNARVKAATTFAFQNYEGMDTTWLDSTGTRWVMTELGPHEQVEISQAIGGIDDEVPVDYLEVELPDGSKVIATSERDFLNLLERDRKGDLKTPYQFVIKQR